MKNLMKVKYPAQPTNKLMCNDIVTYWICKEIKSRL